MHYDIVVIGAGTVGMSAGYYLSSRGKKVALVDCDDPPHENGSHHGDTRVIRHAYGEGEKYVPLALRASELWDDLEKNYGEKIFQNTGVLNIGTKDSPFLKNVFASAEKYSLPVEELSAPEINDRWEGFSLDDHFVGCFEKNSGYLFSEKAIKAYRQLAAKNGARFYFNHRVDKISVKDSIVEVALSSGMITAEKMLISSGKGTNDILSLLGEQLPLSPLRKTFSWFNTDESKYNDSIFPTWSFDDGEKTYYGFPSINHAGVKIGRHDGGIEVDSQAQLEKFGTYAEDRGDVSNFLREHFSDEALLTRGEVCTYTNTPDGDFIIDYLPEYKHIYVACGFSGHGFKFASALGEILSQLILDGTSELDISHFSINRFMRG